MAENTKQRQNGKREHGPWATAITALKKIEHDARSERKKLERRSAAARKAPRMVPLSESEVRELGEDPAQVNIFKSEAMKERKKRRSAEFLHVQLVAFVTQAAKERVNSKTADENAQIAENLRNHIITLYRDAIVKNRAGLLAVLARGVRFTRAELIAKYPKRRAAQLDAMPVLTEAQGAAKQALDREIAAILDRTNAHLSIKSGRHKGGRLDPIGAAKEILVAAGLADKAKDSTRSMIADSLKRATKAGRLRYPDLKKEVCT